jgi:transcriptional regulator with XRE-family HTH domain
MQDEAVEYERFIRMVKIIRQRLKLSLPKLSMLSGVSTTMLHYGETGEKKWSPESCEKIRLAILKALEDQQSEDEKEEKRLEQEKVKKAEKRKNQFLELAEDARAWPLISTGLSNFALGKPVHFHLG